MLYRQDSVADVMGSLLKRQRIYRQDSVAVMENS